LKNNKERLTETLQQVE